MNELAGTESSIATSTLDKDGRREAVILLLLGLVATGLRVFELDRPGIWFDESSSCRWIDFSFSELLQRTAGDCHPPLYWIFLGWWRFLFGGSVGALRSMSVVFGVATVLATYGMVRTLPLLDQCESSTPNRWPAVLAALLIALSPFHIEWSQEMRMYSLATFEAVISTWLFVIALQGGRRTIFAWLGYAAVGIAALYTMYFSGFILAAHGVFAIFRGLATGKWPLGYFAAAASILLGFSPWMPAVQSMVGTVQKSFPQGPLTWPAFATIFWGMFVPPNVPVDGELAPGVLILFCSLVAVLLLFHSSSSRLLIGLCAVIPFQAILSVSLASQNLVGRHRLILGQMFLLIGWALLIGGLRRPMVRWSLALVSLQISLLTTIYYLDIRDARAHLPGMRAAMRQLNELRQPDELVFFVNPMLYLNGIVYMPDHENLFASGRREQFPYYQGSSLTRESDHMEFSAAPSTVQTIWTVDAEQWFGGTWRSNVPANWSLVDETMYDEFYATIVLRKYDRR